MIQRSFGIAFEEMGPPSERPSQRATLHPRGKNKFEQTREITSSNLILLSFSYLGSLDGFPSRSKF